MSPTEQSLQRHTHTHSLDKLIGMLYNSSVCSNDSVTEKNSIQQLVVACDKMQARCMCKD